MYIRSDLTIKGVDGMASETVKKILSAESEADKLNSEARKKAEDIINSAEQQAVVAVQKKLAEAKTQAEKIRKSNSAKIAEYTENAEKECEKVLENIRKVSAENSEKAVDAVISSFFG